MKNIFTVLVSFPLFFCLITGCKNKGKDTEPSSPIATTPSLITQIDVSTPPALINIEDAIQSDAEPLKLSQIASSIKYYPVGDSRYTVTQAIAIPDSDAFITLNFPRIYYRKREIPSKRYGFKALDYKWNMDMNGKQLFYDKKTSRMYVALSGKDKNDKEEGTPYIGELPTLDSMLSISRHIEPEILDTRYPVPFSNEALIGFSSSGYTTYYYEENQSIPAGIRTYSLTGDMLCQFDLKSTIKSESFISDNQDKVSLFSTSYWDEEQNKMSFMLPSINTVYQQQTPLKIVPLYDIHLGEYAITDSNDPGKIHIRTLLENPKGVFMGLHQKNSSPILNWLAWIDDYKPELTHQVVYLKEKDKTYRLSLKEKGFINDLDGGLTFWPDGQTGNSLYMLRTVTEMRERLDRTSKDPKQKELMDFLDNKEVKESYLVMIVVE